MYAYVIHIQSCDRNFFLFTRFLYFSLIKASFPICLCAETLTQYQLASLSDWRNNRVVILVRIVRLVLAGQFSREFHIREAAYHG